VAVGTEEALVATRSLPESGLVHGPNNEIFQDPSRKFTCRTCLNAFPLMQGRQHPTSRTKILPRNLVRSDFLAITVCAEDDNMASPAEEDVLIDLTENEDHEQSRASLQDFLQPLQDTAERVSQQVENFARRLNKFQHDLSPDDQNLWAEAWNVLGDFGNIAQERSRDSQRPSSFDNDDDQKAQIDKIQLEADLWILTKNSLLSRSPQAKEDAENDGLNSLQELHRYSAPPDLWNAFLDCDVVAQEYETLMDWLQDRAARHNIQASTEELMLNSNRGEMKSSAPLFTSYEIKKKKRAIARDGPLAPGAVRGLVSQLDPDAAHRQEGELDRQDSYYEQAAWTTCWEMLRRGMKYSNVQDYWSEASEPFRTTMLTVSDLSMGDSTDSSFLRIINLARNTQWQQICKAAARDPSIPIEQRAVFGLLCGDAGVSNDICHTLEEISYSLVNSLIIERYLHFLSSYESRLQRRTNDPYQPMSATEDRSKLEDLVNMVRADTSFRNEVQSPHKLLELALIGSDINDFLLEMGKAAAEVAQKHDWISTLITLGSEPAFDDHARLAASDADSVRIIAHLQIVWRALGLLEKGYQEDDYIMENNIVSYMAYLIEERKIALLPLYASNLSAIRAYDVLGSALLGVTDNKERGSLIRLMKRYNLDTHHIITAIVLKANQRTIYADEKTDLPLTAERITVTEAKQQTQIRAGFMGHQLSAEDEGSIAAVEWFRWVDETNWLDACASMEDLYLIWFLQGKFSALKTLAARVSLEDVSLAALSMNLTFGADEDEEARGPNGEAREDGDDRGTRSPRKRRNGKATVEPPLAERESRAQLFAKSSLWLQLEQLALALQMLETWQDLANDVEA
jgi:nuclear pore complex protein Nup107